MLVSVCSVHFWYECVRFLIEFFGMSEYAVGMSMFVLVYSVDVGSL